MKYLLFLLLWSTPIFIFAYETKIVRVVDGDTVVASINGDDEKIRIIGINTPESVDPRRTVECFGLEASKRAKEVLNKKEVTLENFSERDRHGRILAYIRLHDGTDFGEMMIKTGHAYSFRSYSHERLGLYNRTEKEARNNKRGLWKPNACDDTSKQQNIVSQERIDFFTEVINIIQALIQFFN